MKENGFAIGLLVGTLVIGGGLVALGLSQGKRYAGLQSEYDDVRSDVERMAKVKPFPTQENLDERKKEVIAFRGKVEGLQNTLQNFSPEKTEEVISPSDFQNTLVSKTAEMKALFEEKSISYPEQFAFGMESYLDGLANPSATAKLNYQLEATEWLFQQIAEAETYEIRNVVREALPSESGNDWKQPYENNRDLDVPLAQSLPMEVIFLADEEATNAIVNAIVDSKEYFFTVDMVRVSSENTSAPVRGQAGLEEAEEAAEEDEGGFGGGGFGAFSFDDEEPEEAVEEATVEEDEEETVVETGKILGQILGNEGTYVALQLRLLLYNEPVELPEFN